MPWLAVVLAGHLSNAGAFVIDKILLRKTLKHPTVYVFYIGVLSLAALLLVPFGALAWPPRYLLVQSAVSGATFMLALLGFFTALQREEATRVVPLFGAIIPMWTLALAGMLLGERLSMHEWWGVILLIVGAVLISYEPSDAPGNMTWSLFFIIAAAAGCFALSSTTLKATFNGLGFINGFLWTRFFGFLSVLPLLLLPTTRHAIFRHDGERPPGLLFIGQLLGAFGFILLAWGTALAPRVAIVNALQGVQYGFLFLLVFVFARLAPKLIPERLSPAILTQKIGALLILSAGLILVA